jgi:hypothetical protein
MIFKFLFGESEWRRTRSQELYLPPVILFEPSEANLEEWLSVATVKEFSGLNSQSLPTNVHILTLERWG